MKQLGLQSNRRIKYFLKSSERDLQEKQRRKNASGQVLQFCSNRRKAPGKTTRSFFNYPLLF